MQAGKNLKTTDASVTPHKVQVMKQLRDEIVRRYL